MPTFRVALSCVLAGLVCIPIGCCGSGGMAAQRRALRQAQKRSWELYNQAQQIDQDTGALAAERDMLQQQLGGLQQQLSGLQSQNSQLQSQLDGLKNERQDLLHRYDNLVNMTKDSKNPLPQDTSDQLTDLASRYPGFEFDPKTGVSKFHSDVLFNSGSSDLRKEALPLLTEFSQIMNQGTAQELLIQVAGHTDDRPVVKDSTRQKHLDNWGLSTNRANQVVRNLVGNGIKNARCSSHGYGPFQPLVPNTDENSRQLNRRVEIFVLAPDSPVAFRANGEVPH